MIDKETITLELTLILLISILFTDWLYIFTIQQEAPIVSHWVIALPMIIPLFFALTLLSLIGIYLYNIWGCILAYFLILFSMFFALISYESVLVTTFSEEIQFIGLMILNLLVFIYIAIFNLSHINNKS